MLGRPCGIRQQCRVPALSSQCRLGDRSEAGSCAGLRNAALRGGRAGGQVLISDVALAVVGSALWRSGSTHGWGWLACTYGIPYLIVNHWLVRPRPAPPPALRHGLSPTSVGPLGGGGHENLQPDSLARQL